MLRELYDTRKNRGKSKYRRGGRPGGDPALDKYLETSGEERDLFRDLPVGTVPESPLLSLRDRTDYNPDFTLLGRLAPRSSVPDFSNVGTGDISFDRPAGELEKQASKLDWNKVKMDKFVPFISNIVNSLRRPPMPGKPVAASTVNLKAPDMNAAREQVRQHTALANKAADVLPANAAAAVRAGNFSASLGQLSQISAQEAAGQADVFNRQQVANQQILTGNNAQRTEYQNQLAERTMASQRQQSENLAGAADKYMGIQEQERQRQADITKLGILSKAYSYGNVSDRWLKKMEEEGLVPPGWDTKKKRAYGGALSGGGGEDPPPARRQLTQAQKDEWNTFASGLTGTIDDKWKRFRSTTGLTLDGLKAGLGSETVNARQIAANQKQLNAENVHTGGMFPKYLYPSGRPSAGNAPGLKLAANVPDGINTLDWDQEAGYPYYTDPTTGDIRYVPKEYMNSPRFRQSGQSADGVDIHRDGGRIHIKPENKGKFTAFAKKKGMGVQEAARHVLANKDKYSSTVVKRANFARNAKKFKHEEGGSLNLAKLLT